jgi:hypothetical protein
LCWKWRVFQIISEIIVKTVIARVGNFGRVVRAVQQARPSTANIKLRGHASAEEDFYIPGKVTFRNIAWIN